MRKYKLPTSVDLPDGRGKTIKYMHFGLEAALRGESPGLYFKNSNLLQYASMYATNPRLLPACVREQVILYSIVINFNRAC